MAIVTLLFYDYFLTFRDEVCVFARLETSLLTLSRYGMRGGGKSRGVRYPGFEGSGSCTELPKVFAIFIMVRPVAPSHIRWTSRLIHGTEQISTDALCDLVGRGYVPQTLSKSYSPKLFYYSKRIVVIHI